MGNGYPDRLTAADEKGALDHAQLKLNAKRIQKKCKIVELLSRLNNNYSVQLTLAIQKKILL